MGAGAGIPVPLTEPNGESWAPEGVMPPEIAAVEASHEAEVMVRWARALRRGDDLLIGQLRRDTSWPDSAELGEAAATARRKGAAGASRPPASRGRQRAGPVVWTRRVLTV